MRVIGTIEARMGSSRLPEKTMMPIFDNLSLLECVVRRFQECRAVEDIVVATTVESRDDVIAEWCANYGVNVFRGSEENVLDRVVGAAVHYGADAIVQAGADSAYLDYELIDQLVKLYRSGTYDFVCNDLTLTYPLGIAAHIVRVDVLVKLNLRSDLTDRDRVDVVRYIWEHPQEYVITSIEAPVELHCPELRLTVDYPEDLAQARAVYAHFGGYRFTTLDIISLFRQIPTMFEGTRHLVQHSAPFLSSKP